ncbi:hypothetical protein LTS18_000314, partial [Coniosporium uncinatum]
TQPGKKRKLPPTWPSKNGKKRKSNENSEDEDDDIPQPGVMKPDITFFGEALPTRFFDHFGGRDQDAVDLIIVMGTSLMVAPVSEIPLHVSPACPQIFISREPIKHIDFDINLLGDCDTVVAEICRRAGWDLKHSMALNDAKVDVSQHPANDCTWIVQVAAA